MSVGDHGEALPDTVVTPLPPDFEVVYRQSYGRMLGLARTVLVDQGAAEEVVQEAFARCYARWDRVENRDDPLPYIRSAVLNLCRSRFRRKRPNLRPVPDAPSAETEAAAGSRRARIIEALRDLPDRQREVVALRYFGELSTAETAAALGIAPGTVKAHLHRAVNALADELEELRRD